MSDTIDNFSGDHRFLSNFWQVRIVYEGVEYPSTEHAYQAAKSIEPTVRQQIAALPRASDAKKLGRIVVMRQDWEQVKLRVMEEILRLKFAHGELFVRLLDTGDRQLVEGNTWGDSFWGVCRGVGENHLGRLLMKIRDELRAVPGEREPLQPPLKWAGGKRWLVPYLHRIYAPHRARRLVEPFVGGMSVALGLSPQRAILRDANPHLINFYLRLRDPSPFVITMENDEALYYSHRERFNQLFKNGESFTTGAAEAAELIYYLNRTCFNGLCRFNRSGGFNVPFGRYKTINYRRDFSAYTPLMWKWQIEFGGFLDHSYDPEDLIYLDPPYDDTFTDYSAGGFPWEMQERLAEMFSRHPGPVVASNQATERVMQLYKSLGYDVDTVEVRRSISANGDRAPAIEMLATKNIDAEVRRSVTVLAPQLNASENSSRKCSSASTVENDRNQNQDHGQGHEQKTNQGEDMAQLPKALADKVGESRVAGGGNWIQHGDYTFLIKKWYYQKIQDECIICELLVVEARKKVVYEGAKAVEQDPNPVASEVSEVANFDGPGKLSAGANSRAVVLGLFGFKEGEVPNQKVTETLMYVTSDAQPAVGMLIGCSTYSKEKRNTKGEFITGRDWDCIAKPNEGVNAPAMVAQRMAALALGPDKCVDVTVKQLGEARAAGTLAQPSTAAAPSTEVAQTPAAAMAALTPTIPVVPAIPAGAPPIPVIPVIDPLAGWTQHPQNADYVFKGDVVKTKAEVLAGARA